MKQKLAIAVSATLALAAAFSGECDAAGERGGGGRLPGLLRPAGPDSKTPPQPGVLPERGREQALAEALAAIPDDGRDRTLAPFFFAIGDGPENDRLPLKATSAEVDIVGVIARVRVDQVYRNEGRTTLEAIYLFPASTRAAVHAMRMTIGERTIEADIRAREQARQEYERARLEGRSASLLEQQRPNVFQMSVATILPGDEIKVELTYSELLAPSEGEYEFVYPAVVGPRYSNVPETGAPDTESWVANPYLHQGEPEPYRFGLSVKLRSGIPIARIASPSHPIEAEYDGPGSASIVLQEGRGGGNRDFLLRYSLQGGRIETGLLLYPGERENFFLLMAEPPARVRPADIVPREYVFIVDVSGSMHGFPLEVSKKLLRDLLSGLRPVDRFNLLLFAGGNSLLAPTSLPASPENLQQAIGTIDRQAGGGGTELLPALKRALGLPRAEGMARAIVLVTDGYVAVERESFELVAGSLGQASMFPFGIGSAVNRHLIEGLARAGAGQPFVVTKPEEAVAAAGRFRKYIEAPLLQGVSLDYEGFDAYDVEPQAVPDLFAARPLIVFGKYHGAARGSITISGAVPGDTFERRIEVTPAAASEGNAALRELWARHRVARLSDLGLAGADDRHAAEITRLGLEYRLLTAHTSFVAIDTVIRGDGSRQQTVRQPLPLPQGVSDLAVGVTASGAIGIGGLGARSAGVGGGGYGRMMSKLSVPAAAPEQTADDEGSGHDAERKIDLDASASRIPDGIEGRRVIERVEAGMERLRQCCAPAPLQGTGGPGSAVVAFTIDTTGRAIGIAVSLPAPAPSGFEACLRKMLAGLRFPKPAGGRPVQVALSFVWRS